MLDFMRLGGAMMWPLLMLGLGAVAIEGRRVLLGVEPALDARRLSSAVLAGSLSWGLLGAARSLLAPLPPDAIVDLRILGLGEALSPMILGLGFFAIVQGLASIASRTVVR